jgi:hypothetical protein
MRHLPSLLGSTLLAALPLSTVVCAAPPDQGFVGAIVYRDGHEADRLACDSLDLIRSIYDAGKTNMFLMHPKFEDLAEVEGVRGKPQCTTGTYGAVRVAEPAVMLGPLDNPMGDAELFVWAIHVDESPKGNEEDYWLLYVDTKTPRPWLQIGTAI